MNSSGLMPGPDPGEQFDTGLLKPSAELHNLMVVWRERLDPALIPGLNARGRKPHKKVSQETAARLIGVTPAWYGRLERGDVGPDYSDDYLDRVAYALRLSDAERQVLYHLAVGRPAQPRVRTTPPSITPIVEQIIEAQPWPAWISDKSWDVLYHNRVTEQWLPHFRYESNIMRWLWAYPDAQLQLVDYQTVWAPLMLAQMRFANSRWPGTARLEQLITEAMQTSKLFRHLWHTDPMVYHHPDGDRRWMHVPGRRDPIEIEIRAWMPLGDEELRVVFLVPTEPDSLVFARTDG